jgi:hypothetical protein
MTNDDCCPGGFSALQENIHFIELNNRLAKAIQEKEEMKESYKNTLKNIIVALELIPTMLIFKKQEAWDNLIKYIKSSYDDLN